MLMRIQKVTAREIIDSRGNPTVEATVFTDKGCGRGRAPSGASKGTKEAIELRDGGKRFSGKGVLKAVGNVGKISKAITGLDPHQQGKIDKTIVELDSTQNFSRLGANATTAVSLAVCAAAANSMCLPIYSYLNKKAATLPIPMSNIINGGLHAGNALAVQEFMVMPIKFNRFSEALRAVCEIYQVLGGKLEKQYGRAALNVGNEGGFAPPMRRTTEALEAIEKSISAAGYADKVFIGIDAAASSFFNGKYLIDGKKMNADELLKVYQKVVNEYPVVSIEDPFEENDWKHFAAATSQLKIRIVGDDLFVSKSEYLREGLAKGAANAVLLKVNQVGTLTGAWETAKLAQQNGYAVIVSHRSGETEDTFISDLAVALEAHIKTGAPTRGERTAKYNRLLEIEQQLGRKARYAKW